VTDGRQASCSRRRIAVGWSSALEILSL